MEGMRQGRPHVVFCTFVVVALLICCSRPAAAQSVPDVSGLPISGTNALQGDLGKQISEAMGERGGQTPPEDAEPAEPAEDAESISGEITELQPAQEGPSRIERLLSREPMPDPNEVPPLLKQFGYDVFRTAVTTFAPVMNVPVGPDYVIGPGDSFALTLWGRVDARHTLQVDRDGQIVLPEVGALKVWGMKFADLEGYLQHELSRKYTDFKMSITMERLRTIQVFVVGEASAPGTYTLSSLSTVINALFAAGGPSRDGTLRRVRLFRNGQDPVEIDLYRFLLGGDKSDDMRLQNGDTIFIPLIGTVVGVSGDVKRPAIYEMVEPMTLSDVLDLAGGITFAGWLQRVQVERVENHRRRIVVDFDLSDASVAQGLERPLETIIRDGDVINIFPVAGEEQNVVSLDGHVLRPGKYEWKRGLRLRDIVSSYEVMLPQPHLDYGQIERLIPPDLHPRILPFHLGRLMAGDESQNLELQQYDTIRIFAWDERTMQTVSVSGNVFDPNRYRLVPEMRVSDLVDVSGGLAKNAYTRRAELTRRHISQEGMTTEKIDIGLEKALAGDPEHNLLLHDYDHLVVRPIPDLAFGLNAEIAGEVRFPGTYPIRKGETLSSLIERAGGYTDQAYLKGAVFTRESAKEVQQRRLNEMVRQLEESMLTSTQESISGALDAETARGEAIVLETKRELLTRLLAAEVTGRVVVRLDSLEDFRRSKYDIELEDGDALTIPQTPGVVHVVGEVFNSTSLLYEQDGTVGRYLQKVGGMTKEADKDQVSVIKADGSVFSVQQGKRARLVFWDSSHNSWFFGGFMSYRMDPGDTIVVPRKVDRFFWLKTTKDITQIVFQIAVAAGVVFAI